jgi:hypothetical protein
MADAKQIPATLGNLRTLVGEIVGAHKRLVDRIQKLEARQLEVEQKGIRYRGIWQQAQSYGVGDLTTFRGSLWHCCGSDMREQPGTGRGWQLCVKSAQER